MSANQLLTYMIGQNNLTCKKMRTISPQIQFFFERLVFRLVLKSIILFCRFCSSSIVSDFDEISINLTDRSH